MSDCCIGPSNPPSGGGGSDEWNAGSVTALGAGLSIDAETLVAQWQAGPIDALGSGLSFGGSDHETIVADWQAGTVNAIGAGLTLVSDTLTATGALSEWQAGTVTALGANLSLTSGTLAATGGGGGGGAGNALWVLPNNPTIGSFAQINISGTVTATASGTSNTVTLFDGGSNALKLEGLTLAVPVSTPYRVAILAYGTGQSVQYNSQAFGWTDGTKFETMTIVNSFNVVTHSQWSNSASRATDTSVWTIFASPYGMTYGGLWIGLRDDGTNVHYELSQDGVNFITIFTVTKSSGYLGSSGYSHIFFGVVPDNAAPQFLSIRCYDPAGLTRAFP